MSAVFAAVCHRYIWQGETRKIYAFLENGIVTCKDGDGSSLGSYEFSGDALLGPGPLSQTRRNGVAAEIVRVIQPSNHPVGDPNVVADSDPQMAEA